MWGRGQRGGIGTGQLNSEEDPGVLALDMAATFCAVSWF